MFQEESVEDFEKYGSKNAKTAMNIIKTQPGAQFAEGSYWQAFNAVTFMTDHVLGRENDTRLASSWYATCVPSDLRLPFTAAQQLASHFPPGS